MNRLAACLAPGFLCCLFSGAVLAQSGTGTEAAALSQLLREAARDAAAACPSGPVLLRVLPDHVPPVVRQMFAEALMDRELTVQTAGEGERCRLTVDVRGMHSSTVSTTNSSYLRKIVVTLGLLAEEAGGRVTYARERTLERGDTLQGEAPFKHHSYLDDEASWWEGLVEPVLVSVAAVVIAVLLFTVRGSS